jgi:catechol 2,3-dioxygenase-like lactoylglutathione lyase family enzyme
VASLQTHNGGPSIELAQYLNQQGEPLAAATNQPGSCHLCLVVSDLSGCHADLKTKGVEFKSEPVSITEGPNKGGLVVYLRDPDGYTIELFEPPLGAAA